MEARMSEGYSESVSVDEGVDAYGTRTQLKFEGDSLIVQKSFDGKGMADACKAINTATAGQRWGEMRHVGTLPMAVYGKALAFKDNRERIKYIRNWLAQNPDFITFDRYMK
jgi:hypothetical protein